MCTNTGPDHKVDNYTDADTVHTKDQHITQYSTRLSKDPMQLQKLVHSLAVEVRFDGENQPKGSQNSQGTGIL